jgi:acetyltransferase-like isoleucine patch superfamily enzyme
MKSFVRRCSNRVFHHLARFSPGATTLRPWLHRARGVAIGREVFIGDDVYIDNEYPESIEIQDGVQISIRAMIIAHTRGPGKVIIEKDAFVGPNVVIVCSAGRVLRIGEGAVLSAGCVITRNVAPRTVLTAAPPQVAGRATIPLTRAKTMEEFSSGLTP